MATALGTYKGTPHFLYPRIPDDKRPEFLQQNYCDPRQPRQEDWPCNLHSLTQIT